MGNTPHEPTDEVRRDTQRYVVSVKDILGLQVVGVFTIGG